MPSWKSRKESLWSDFIETTTLHGPNHISSTKNFWRKYYIIVVFIMSTMFTTHAAFLIYQYLQYPMNTDIKFQNILYSYPDITICPNSASSVYLMNMSQTAEKAYNFTKEFWQNKPIDRESWTKTSKRSYLKYYYKFSSKIGRMPHHHILWCEINGLSCLEKIFITEHPIYYRCFTLRPATSSILPGATHGITLLLHRGDPSLPVLQLNEEFSFEEQSSFSESTIQNLSGFIIGFHDRNSFPNFPLTALPAYINAKYGDKFRISLDLTGFKAANMVLRPCGLTKDMEPIKLIKVDPLSSNGPLNSSKEFLSFAYLRQSCIGSKRQELIFNKCGCFSEYYNIPYLLRQHGTLWCFDVEGKTDKIINIFKTIKCVNDINLMSENEVLYEFISEVSEKYKFIKSFDICPLRCDRLIHLVHSVYKDKILNSISLNNFQNYFEYLQLNNLSNKFINSNDSLQPSDVITLDISAVSEYVNNIEEYPAFDLLSLISQIGCISGLYVGITVFTVFELVELFFRVSFFLISNRLKK